MAEKIIISRTDSIGDVVLTLPVAGAIKAFMPGAEIIFLGRDYTREVVALSRHIDRFVSWDEQEKLDEEARTEWMENLEADKIIHVFPRPDVARLAAKAKIPLRIGSTGRIYNYRYCNKLVPLSRKNSGLHESQLNFKLLRPLIKDIETPSLETVKSYYGFRPPSDIPGKILSLIDRSRFNLILHPKSKGSAREWPAERYSELINLLPVDRFKIFVTGTKDESTLISGFLNENKEKITNLTGKFSLKEFVQFISLADGLVAASTGPLHIAAALGKLAIGIYPPIRPMHPGRWAPVGEKAKYLVMEKKCNDCRKTGQCHCMTEITATRVKQILEANARK